MMILLKNIYLRKFSLTFLLNILLCLPIGAQQTGGLTKNIIVDKPTNESDYPIIALDHTAATILYDINDYKGVIRAIGDLQSDVDSVAGVKPGIVGDGLFAYYEIVIGTLGKSKVIDELVSSGKLDTKDLNGKWESFVIATIENPKPNVKKCLVIAGSDKRGAIYGIYKISRQLGVSPWY